MFCVDDSTAQAIQRAYDEGGELSAAIELRRHFCWIVDLAAARRCARIIVGWTPRRLIASKEPAVRTERAGAKRDRRGGPGRCALLPGCLSLPLIGGSSRM
jgi:hypothetical protein